MKPLIFAAGSLLLLTGCSANAQRGIAGKRTDFKQFTPLKDDPARYGLKAVRPVFKGGDRSGVLHAIETACQGGKAGSSRFDPRTGAGYYVNCNARNRQLLNGYIPLDPHTKPHSERE